MERLGHVGKNLIGADRRNGRSRSRGFSHWSSLIQSKRPRSPSVLGRESILCFGYLALEWPALKLRKRQTWDKSQEKVSRQQAACGLADQALCNFEPRIREAASAKMEAARLESSGHAASHTNGFLARFAYRPSIFSTTKTTSASPNPPP